ncbi:MAG: 23S rRNA (uracil(1939)-C(5))-methyltransferase RlmD [Desulfuromonadales bacterium]
MAKAPARPRPTKKNPLPLIELTIDRLDDDGVGISRHGGKEVLVPGALPGEKVAIAIERAGQRRSTGSLVRVIEPHPRRIPSPCKYLQLCQGCLLSSFDYPAQLDFKADRVSRALSRYPSLNQVLRHPLWPALRPLGYRTSAKLVFGRHRGRVTLGLYRRGTHDVVDTGDCPIHHPLINRIVRTVKEEVARQEVFVYDQVKRRGLLRYLTIRVSPAFDKALVTFVTAERNYRETTHLAKWLQKKVPEVIGVHQNVNASAGAVIFGRETLRVLGAPDLIDQVGEVRLRIAPTAFFQVNNEQAGRIYELVRQWAALARDEYALDIYCGIGGIALHLAQDAGRVIGIEVAEEAVRNARENARLNGLQNCDFHAGDAAERVHDLIGKIPPGAVAVINPPRGGCEPPVLQALANLAPRALIYVSCDPDTLARDLDLLAGLGYRTEEVQPVDMFPHTPHVETVARLTPAHSVRSANKGG